MAPEIVHKPLIATVFRKGELVTRRAGFNVGQAVLQLCWRPRRAIAYNQIQEGKRRIWELPTEISLMESLDEIVWVFEWLQPGMEGS